MSNGIVTGFVNFEKYRICPVREHGILIISYNLMATLSPTIGHRVNGTTPITNITKCRVLTIRLKNIA